LEGARLHQPALSLVETSNSFLYYGGKESQVSKIKHGASQISTPEKSVMPSLIEIEIAEGLEFVTRDEVTSKLDVKVTTGKGAVSFLYTSHLKRLLGLNTAHSIYLVLHFDVPRPRALLGHEHFQRILHAIETVLKLHPTQHFQTLHISAAGAESSVMIRIKDEIAVQTGLKVNVEAGDLMLRIRRSGDGWDVLIRLTPRPLATRDWRICNFEGALNGPTAHSLIRLLNPKPEEVFLNLACGSGTLLIERLTACPAQHVIGVDNAPHALQCCQANIMAAKYDEKITLLLADAKKLPLANQSIDAIAADLPFGQLVGTHKENSALYPAILKEASRVAQIGACFALITHEIRLIEEVLARQSQWVVENTLPISLRGLHPRIYLLRRQ